MRVCEYWAIADEEVDQWLVCDLKQVGSGQKVEGQTMSRRERERVCLRGKYIDGKYLYKQKKKGNIHFENSG